MRIMRHKEGCLLALSCLFLRAMSQADAKHPFGECRVASLMPRQPAAGFGLNKVYLKGTKYGKY